jgi:hypothetical protein
VREKYVNRIKVIGFSSNNNNTDPKTMGAYKLPRFPVVKTFPHRYLLDLSLVLYAPWVRSVPSNVIIDQKGQMVWRTGEWTDATIERTKQELNNVMARENEKRP